MIGSVGNVETSKVMNQMGQMSFPYEGQVALLLIFEHIYSLTRHYECLRPTQSSNVCLVYTTNPKGNQQLGGKTKVKNPNPKHGPATRNDTNNAAPHSSIPPKKEKKESQIALQTL